MNIVITGASGFLGRILSQKLSIKGHKITSVSRTSPGIVADISKPFSLPPDLMCDLFIHAAGKAHSNPKNEQEAQAFFDVNFQGTIHLCQALEQLETPPKTFVFISSVSVYGAESGQMINESHPLHGSTPYAKSKIQAEEFLISWANRNQVRLTILRLPLILGPNPPGNLGSMIKGMKKGLYLSIGDTTARKSMVWGEDIADHIEILSRVEGTFNLTDGYHPTLKELETEISKKLRKTMPKKVPLWIARILGKIGDVLGDGFPVNSPKINKLVSELTFDDEKAVRELQWEPTRVLLKIGDII